MKFYLEMYFYALMGTFILFFLFFINENLGLFVLILFFVINMYLSFKEYKKKMNLYKGNNNEQI